MTVGLTDLAALVGIVVGTAGLVLGIVNYLRDRPKVEVRLIWDMSVVPNPVFDTTKKWGIITVCNLGRRPIFVSRVSLKLPKRKGYLMITQGIQGKTLAEGDSPENYPFEQPALQNYQEEWHKIRAVVFDSADAKYFSPRPDKSKPPSWVNPPKR